MEQKLHLVDTCIIIDYLRGNQIAIDLLSKLKGRIVVSYITIIELYRGAKTKEKKQQLDEQLKAYHKAIIDKDISIKSLSLMKKYISGHQDLCVGDCLIAATAVINRFPLHTNNIKDFDFIEGLILNPRV